MPKPWARVEVGYMRHPKFLALNGNAISLWHEGKDYCDTHHTDGRIPPAALRTFRFHGKASVILLTTSCGQKPNGTAYAPLWATSPQGGYQMHDYLQHNDCREVVLARIEQAEQSRAVDRERLKRWRARKKVKRVETAFQPPFLKRDVKGHSNVSETLLSETVSETEQERTTAAAPRHPLAKEPSGGNFGPIAKLAAELLKQGSWRSDDDTFVIASESDLVNALKDECARLGIDRGAHPDVAQDVIHRAAASEWFKHTHPDIVRRVTS